MLFELLNFGNFNVNIQATKKYCHLWKIRNCYLFMRHRNYHINERKWKCDQYPMADLGANFKLIMHYFLWETRIRSQPSEFLAFLRLFGINVYQTRKICPSIQKNKETSATKKQWEVHGLLHDNLTLMEGVCDSVRFFCCLIVTASDKWKYYKWVPFARFKFRLGMSLPMQFQYSTTWSGTYSATCLATCMKNCGSDSCQSVWLIWVLPLTLITEPCYVRKFQWDKFLFSDNWLPSRESVLLNSWFSCGCRFKKGDFHCYVVSYIFMQPLSCDLTGNNEIVTSKRGSILYL